MPGTCRETRHHNGWCLLLSCAHVMPWGSEHSRATSHTPSSHRPHGPHCTPMARHMLNAFAPSTAAARSEPARLLFERRQNIPPLGDFGDYIRPAFQYCHGDLGLNQCDKSDDPAKPEKAFSGMSITGG